MKRTIKIINILMIVLMLTMVLSNVVLAVNPSGLTPSTSGTGIAPVKKIGNQITGVLQVAGSIVSIAMLIVLGIKYMMGSAEEKAEYKKTLMPYVIGAILVFAAVNIASMVFNMSKQITT